MAWQFTMMHILRNVGPLDATTAFCKRRQTGIVNLREISLLHLLAEI